MRSKFFWKNFLSFVLIIGFTTFVVSYLLIIQTQQFIEATATDGLREKLTLFEPYFEDGVSSSRSWSKRSFCWPRRRRLA